MLVTLGDQIPYRSNLMEARCIEEEICWAHGWGTQCVMVAEAALKEEHEAALGLPMSLHGSRTELQPLKPISHTLLHQAAPIPVAP